MGYDGNLQLMVGKSATVTAGLLPQNYGFQSFHSLPPVRHVTPEQTKKLRAVIMNAKVTQLVHDDVLDGVKRPPSL